MTDQVVNVDNQPPASAVTAGNQNSPAPSNNGSNAGTQGNNNSVPSNNRSYTEDGRDLEREAAKIAKLEKDNEELNRRFSSVAGFVSKSPERYKKALMETSGKTEAEAEAMVKAAHPDWSPKGKTASTQTTQTSTLAPEDKAALDELKQTKAEKERKMNDSFIAFEKKYPDLDSDDITAIVGETRRLMNKQGLALDDALEEARTKIFEPEQYVKQGQIEGMGRAYSGTQSSSTGPVGGGSKGGARVRSALDAEVYSKLGLTKEQQELADSYDD